MPNAVMLQYFEWYLSADHGLWCQLEKDAFTLARSGFDTIWIPPACKAAGGARDIGYALYDLWDLGEFDQKGTVPTKYGTKDELMRAVKAVHAQGMSVLADVVLNHKDGGDKKERFRATPFRLEDRDEATGEEREIEAWTHFTFPGRGETYSAMQWHWEHFTAASYDARSGQSDQVLRFAGKDFDQDVDHELGNYDYLMANDIDHAHPEVQDELRTWGRWLVETLGVNGFRLDAVKHISARFYRDWLTDLRQQFPDRELFAVGEYWHRDAETLKGYLSRTDGAMSLFDVGLHHNFHAASQAGREYDLRTLLDGTLVRDAPVHAVTFVENHDTQPGQGLESPVSDWFKPLAYAFILLREQGYPCVFYGDYYGVHHSQPGTDREVNLPALRPLIDTLIKVRKEHAWGEQDDYFDQHDTIGWVRHGDKEHPKALAVVMGNGEPGSKPMCVQRPGAAFRDATSNSEETISIGDDGWGVFPHGAGSVSVWAEQ